MRKVYKMTMIKENIALNVNKKRPEGLKPDGSPYRVLIVDDSPVLRMIINRILKSESYEIAGEAADGAEAIYKYDELKPDLVTMDIDMPVMDGITALQNILSRDPSARVLMLTGENEGSTVVTAIQAGARNYAIKTAERGAILSRVRQSLASNVISLGKSLFAE